MLRMARSVERRPSSNHALTALPAFEGGSGEIVNVVIETVQGSCNKFKFDDRRGVFRVSTILPTGSVFPFDFGFVPSTLGEDGDPLDVLVLMDGPTFPGCVIECRLIGVIEARQRERDGRTGRNDRLIAVARKDHRYRHVARLTGLGDPLVTEIEEFFVNYTRLRGKAFMPLGRRGPKAAKALIRKGMAHAEARRGRRRA